MVPTDVGLVVVAAGASVRAGTDKLMTEVAGRPLLAHTLTALRRSPVAGPLVVVARAETVEEIRELEPDAVVVPGGDTRTESELAGVEALAASIESGEVQIVAIHDGARPLVSPDLIDRVVATARKVGGAIPVLPLTDRLVGADLDTVDRVGLWRVQTPQAFQARPLLAALRTAVAEHANLPDTAAAVRLYTDCPIETVPGEAINLKVTYSEDLADVARLLAFR